MLVVAGIALGSALTENAHAKRRIRGKGPEFRLRGTLAYGLVDYRSVSFATNTRTSLAGEHFGGRFQAEAWFNERLGIMLDSEMWYAGVNGSDIYYYYFNLPLGFRLLGQGGAMGSELVLFAGPSLIVWPDVRAHFRTTSYDLVNPKHLAAYGGLRWRQAITPEYTLELAGYYMHPLRLVGTSSSTLSTIETRNVGGSITLDYKFYDGLGASLGYMYELNRMSYVPSGNTNNLPQTINVDVSAGMLSLRFWF